MLNFYSFFFFFLNLYFTVVNNYLKGSRHRHVWKDPPQSPCVIISLLLSLIFSEGCVYKWNLDICTANTCLRCKWAVRHPSLFQCLLCKLLAVGDEAFRSLWWTAAWSRWLIVVSAALPLLIIHSGHWLVSVLLFYSSQCAYVSQWDLFVPVVFFFFLFPSLCFGVSDCIMFILSGDNVSRCSIVIMKGVQQRHCGMCLMSWR